MKTSTKILFILGAIFIPLIPYIHLRKIKRMLGIMGMSVVYWFTISAIAVAIFPDGDDPVFLVIIFAAIIVWDITIVRDVLRIAKEREAEKQAAVNNSGSPL